MNFDGRSLFYGSLALAIMMSAGSTLTFAAESSVIIPVWPDSPPGPAVDLPPEADTTTEKSNKVAGRRLIRLGNVTIPDIHVFQPAENANGTGVVICPGGGHNILAWDLEGTEVAEWLNSLGVTAFVLKYRVPAQDQKARWREAVQDAQRAMSIIRDEAEAFDVDPDKIGICGFSAGGETAALTALFTERQYEAVDEIDEVPYRPDFMLLIYPAYLVKKDNATLQDYVKVTESTPPAFIAHAYDDPVRVESSVLLFLEMKKAGIPAELHVYTAGGHGYGLRRTEHAVTTWTDRCEEWLRARELIPAE